MKKALWVLPVLGLMVGCASTKEAPVEQKPAVDAAAEAAAAAKAAADRAAAAKAAADAEAARLAAQRAAMVDPINDPNSPLFKDKAKVYFDFDKYDIKDEYTSLVQAHGAYLSKNGDKKVRIEGNADERGSREYNLALGQKRAEAVKKGLASYGATDGQLEAISNGKEKPKAEGHDEAAWAENRRADVIYH